jgi:UDPglucose 6-dehydrogenase/GDP-mannose 6-dehydrogenase
MQVSVVGTGYVGLISGICLADKGHQVTCVDIDQAKVDKINSGIAPIYEAGLDDLMKKNVGHRFNATSDLREAVLNTQISIIAVGTPFDGDDIDLTFIKEVTRQIGTILKNKNDYHLVIVKSTVVPGTTDDVVLRILEESSGKQAGVDFGVGMNPEFLREGEAISDFMNPDRIVLGGIDEKSISVLRELYDVFSGVDKIETNCKTAEMIKYTANSLLATMISFANEIANLCSTIGNIDILEVTKGVHLDRRLSPILPNGQRIMPTFTTYIEAGCGFGGSCFPKDVKALCSFGAQRGQPMNLLNAVIDINNKQYQQIIRMLHEHFPKIKGIRVAVLGLAFKPDTDDIRESPSIPVINYLLDQSAIVKTYDPIATHEAKKQFKDAPIQYCASLIDTIKDVDVIIIMTRWAEFNKIPNMISQTTPSPLLIDGRRMLNKKSVKRYEGIGL